MLASRLVTRPGQTSSLPSPGWPSKTPDCLPNQAACPALVFLSPSRIVRAPALLKTAPAAPAEIPEPPPHKMGISSHGAGLDCLQEDIPPPSPPESPDKTRPEFAPASPRETGRQQTSGQLSRT